jgi:hypothetical protein
MEPKGSLPHSHEPASCLNSEPDQSGPCTPSHLRSILILSSHLCLGLPSGLSPLGFPTKTLHAPLPHTRYMATHLILLDLITQILFSEEYRSLSSSLRCLFYYPVISALLVPHTFLSTLFSNHLSPILKRNAKTLGTYQCPVATMSWKASWI